MSKNRGVNIESSETAEINTSILNFSTGFIFLDYLDLRVISDKSSSYALCHC